MPPVGCDRKDTENEGLVVLQKLLENTHRVARWSGYVSGFVMVAMMLLMVIDFTLRFLFDSPILGSFELTQLCMVLIVSGSFAYAQTEDGHVRITMFVDRFPMRLRSLIQGFGLLLGAAMMILVAYAGFLQGGESADRGQITSVLGIPVYPFYYLLGAGILIYVLVLLVHALCLIMNAVKPSAGGKA